MPQSEPLRIINPPELGRPNGFAHGVATPSGSRVLYVAGQTATDEHGRIAERGFIAQFDRALHKVVQVVTAAGADASRIARMTIYVTDLESYRVNRPRLRDVWRRHMGDHYPAMALVQVSALVDQDANVEIQADAVIP